MTMLNSVILISSSSVVYRRLCVCLFAYIIVKLLWVASIDDLQAFWQPSTI